MMPLLQLRDLTKRFDGLIAVDSLSFSIEPGETISIIGPNGAGKTTVFNMISGFIKPTRGQIIFDGRDIVGRKPHQIARAGLGRTFQLVKPFRGLTVFENVLAGALTRQSARKEAERIAADALQFAGLAHLGDQLAGQLPLAFRKRLELARALAAQPRMILLDEVMAGLTPAETKQAAELIKRLKSERGIAAIAGVEHIIEVVISISDRIIVLNYGRKIAEGKPEHIVNNREVIAAYLGE
jgi:ABC-type branched-subunit amino acid transport system ATPase component